MSLHSLHTLIYTPVTSSRPHHSPPNPPSFQHDQPQSEICCVLFARDEKRGSDAVYAAGWNRKVFVWQDEDAAVVGQYRSFEGHRDDVLAMAAAHRRGLLATGE
jgi:hypothetical protein